MSNNGKPVERWRTVLAWGCVVIFLLAPVFIFGLHMIGFLQGIENDLDYLSRWYFAITGVLISLAGLNTIIQVKNGRKQNGNGEPQPPHEPQPPRTI